MYQNCAIAQTSVVDALRPRSSGRAVDAHVVRPPREPKPDYEKMRQFVQGTPDKETSGDR